MSMQLNHNSSLSYPDFDTPKSTQPFYPFLFTSRCRYFIRTCISFLIRKITPSLEIGILSCFCLTRYKMCIAKYSVKKETSNKPMSVLFQTCHSNYFSNYQKYQLRTRLFAKMVCIQFRHINGGELSY